MRIMTFSAPPWGGGGGGYFAALGLTFLLSVPGDGWAADECGALDPATDAGRSITCTTNNYDSTQRNIFYEISDEDANYDFTVQDGVTIRGRRSNKGQAREAGVGHGPERRPSDYPIMNERNTVVIPDNGGDTVNYDAVSDGEGDDGRAQNDPQDDHGRRGYAVNGVLNNPDAIVRGSPPNTLYGGIFIDTGVEFNGDITLRSDADITVDNEPFSTNDEDLRMGRREGLNPIANARGISVRHYGRSGNLDLTVGGRIRSVGHGVHATIDSRFNGTNEADAVRDDQFEGDITLDLTPSIDIETSGRRGAGVRAYHFGQGNIRVTARGTPGSTTPNIKTTGEAAAGIDVEMGNLWDPFDASVRGHIDIDLTDFVIRTEGNRDSQVATFFSSGVKTYQRINGDIDVDVTGSTIQMTGEGRRGILATHFAAGQIDIGVMDSTIETGEGGVGANAIMAQHQWRGPITITAHDNEITTRGTDSHGIWGRHLQPGAVTITTRGNMITTRGVASYGIYGYKQLIGNRNPRDDITIDSNGDTIATYGLGAHGIYGRHEGSRDKIVIQATNSDIRTAAADAYGIHAHYSDRFRFFHRIQVDVDGGSIKAGCGTATYEDCQGKGIVAAFDRGSIFNPAAVTIRNGARIEAATAVQFMGGPGQLVLSDSTLTGNVVFDTGNFGDQLTITQQASGQMGGDIDFGDGDDMIDITVPTGQHFMFNGPIYGLNRFTQSGGGVVRFARAPFPNEDMTFNVNGGSLVVADEIRLGEGELIIANAGKLVFEVSRDTTDVTWGQIFGDVRFEGDDDPSVYIQFHPDAGNLDALRAGLKLAASEDDDDDDSVSIELIYGRVTQGSETDNEGLMEIDLKSQPTGGGTAQTVGTVKGEGDEEDVNTRRRFVAMIDDDGVNQIARLDVPGSLPSLTSPSTSPPPSSSGSGGGTTSAGGGGGGAPSTPTPPVDPTPTPPPSATGQRPSVGDTTTTTWFTLTVPESMMPANPAERMVSGAYGIWMNCADAVCALRQGFESHARVSEALPAVLLDLNRAPLQGEQVHHDGTGAWASLIGTSVDRDLRDSTATTSYSLAQSGVRLGYDFETSSIGTFGVSLHRQTGTAAIDHGGDIDTVVTGVRLSHRWDMTPMTVGLHATATSFASDLMSFERGSLVNDLSGSGVAVGIEANQRRTLGDATLTLGGAVTHQRVSTDGFTAHLPDANAAAGVTPVQVTDVRGRETTARLQASYHTPMTDGDWFVGGAVDLPLHRSASVAVEDTRLSAETRPSLSLQGGLAVTGATGTTTLFSLGYAQESGGERVQATLRMNF